MADYLENTTSVPGQFFDRFDPPRGPADADILSRDLADLLGSRRPYPVNLPGILSWGLPGMAGISPGSDSDREQVAEQIASAIRRFEPRLANVKVTPSNDSVDFAFVMEAAVVGRRGGNVRRQIQAPRRGGGLSADVARVARNRD